MFPEEMCLSKLSPTCTGAQLRGFSLVALLPGTTHALLQAPQGGEDSYRTGLFQHEPLTFPLKITIWFCCLNSWVDLAPHAFDKILQFKSRSGFNPATIIKHLQANGVYGLLDTCIPVSSVSLRYWKNIPAEK